MRPRSSALALVVVCLPFAFGCSNAPTEQVSGARLDVRLVANQQPIAIADGTTHETPVDQRVGILGLELLRTQDDASPMTVFRGSSPVDTAYNDGDDTLVGSADVASLTAGTYAFARVPIAYVKFTVDGTYHADGVAVAGQFEDTISVSSNAMIDGAPRARGWFSDSFLESGVTAGTLTGEGASIAQPPAASGIRLDLSTSEAAYVFPADIVVDPTVDHDITFTFTLNTYADFHWQDESAPGYTAGVFDVSDGTWEPVTQIGANSVSFSSVATN